MFLGLLGILLVRHTAIGRVTIVHVRQSPFFQSTHLQVSLPLNLYSRPHISHYGQVKTKIYTGYGLDPHPTCCLDSIYAWNVTSHTLTAASAPVPTSLPLLLPLPPLCPEPEREPEPTCEDSQSTALTPPGTAFLMAMFFNGFRTLHTYICVS